MITYNQDGVYFKITSNDIRTEVDEKAVISLAITEEREKLTTGSLVLQDETGAYYSSIKRGAILSIEWGYARIGIKQAQFRKGIAAMVVSPAHNMDGAEPTTTINFRSGFSLIKDRKVQVFKDTKKNMISLVMQSAGVVNKIIDFSGNNESGQWRQDSETDFQFLARLARIWKKQFIAGYDLRGNPTAAFTDFKSNQNNNILKTITGQIPTEAIFEYRAGRRNVISASIEENFSENGSGEQIRFELIDGRAVKQVSQASTEVVRTLRLDSEALLREQKEVARKQGTSSAAKWTQDILEAKTFEDKNIKRFWKPIDYKTAQPHSGTKIDIVTFGSPFYTVPSKVRLGAGFPSSVADAVGPAGRGYEIAKCTHTIGGDGYKCSLEIRNYLNL